MASYYSIIEDDIGPPMTPTPEMESKLRKQMDQLLKDPRITFSLRSTAFIDADLMEILKQCPLNYPRPRTAP